MLVPAARYLTYTEAVVLYNELLQADIVVLVKAHGPPSLPYGEGMYYQLLIEEALVETAQPLLTNFEQERTAPKLPRCPRCGSLAVAPAERVAWWRQLLYVGTTPMRCATCQNVFAG
ncbi:hypothetical protein F1C16_07715 [Hymenobacter sp. NBH84]|uniref:hypothetical protein n=1 Tax=Hymenobacter sp. NBH84 TaxID=2596915 RepID=UPI0016264F20|nr:hypothetical protein [Hymenobacter sp. NBH84]QNE39448.1 hypothetical protein F1C16_07715 [Hymenobacter sp. NBH84]